MQECKIVRLTTKEVLICKVAPVDMNKDNMEEIYLEDPYEIKSFMNPQSGDFNSTLIDWMQFCDDNVSVVDTFNIITVNNPSSELKEHYELILSRRQRVGENDTFRKVDRSVAETDHDEYSLDDYMHMLTNKTLH
jgi:hypothetical protein